MVIDKLKNLLTNQLSIDSAIINEDTDIINDLGADSLDIAELLMGIEDEFGILLTEEMTENIHTVGQLAALIDKESE